MLFLLLVASRAGGFDNHLILMDLRNKETDGGRAEKVLRDFLQQEHLSRYSVNDYILLYK